MKLKTISKVLCLVMLTFTFAMSAQQIKKENTSVLYVGFNPEKEMPDVQNTNVNGGMDIERFKEDLKTRMPAFKSYLELYFKTVKTVDARDFKPEMSADYDVTIFDQVINPWKDRVSVLDVNGQLTKYEPAKYLTEDFNYPTIFIGHTAPVMGQSIGLKLDWLCLCLDADAHHLKLEHPIFNGPFEVNPTMTTKPTPEGIFHYESGKNVPKEIPMWRVQKEGYLEGNGYRIGLVARGTGFLDSPDTEFISSGVNSKDVDAVAIGRHGNFLLWGFSASPDYMTDEAKQVFANAVMYIKQFKGQKPIARKYNDRIATKAFVDGIIHSTTEEAYQDYIKQLEAFNISKEKMVAEAKEKKANGETLEPMETMMLNYPNPQAIPIWEDYIKSNSRNYFERFGTDTQALHAFLKANKEFFYSEPEGFYELELDEDAQSLGISNSDINLIDTAIKLLENNNLDEKAKRILKRYTNEDFTTAKAWRQWFNTNKGRLFFTQAGGFVWLVDTTK